MTRFEMEWSGQLGAFWEKHAHEEAERLIAQRDEMIVEDDGAVKWASSGNYLPADCVEKLLFGGADWFDADATARKRDAQNEAFLESYRKAQTGRKRSAEEIAEMRAAFGEGAVVVDVLTGERFAL